MAIIIDATAAGASANSYVTLAEANAYFASRLGSSLWNDQDDETKKAALVTAANHLEAQVYRGARATDTQRLAWPRSGVYRTGYLLPLATNPELIKQAQMEEALALLALAVDVTTGTVSDPLAPSGTENLRSLRAGSVTLDFIDRGETATSAAAADDPSKIIASPQAYGLLRPYLLTDAVNMPTGARNVRLLRG